MHWKTTALLVAAFILAGSSLLAIAGDAKDAAVKKDRKALQGTWKTDKDNEAGITSMRFDGEKCVMTFRGDITASGTYTIDPTQKPRTIDIKVTGVSDKIVEKYKGKVSLGVYQIDGAKLTWHGNEPGAVSRPKSLTESLTKEEHVLIVFEKEKK